jgi:photosystem II stability/assembly factor-like uncharacterized protein
MQQQRFILLPLPFIFFLEITMHSAQAQPLRVYAAMATTHKHALHQKNPAVGIFIGDGLNTDWQHVGWENAKCFSPAVDPTSNGKTLYGAYGNGVMKSSDGGEHWKIVTGWEITEVLKVCIDPKTPSTVYAACAYGVFKSTDAGETWKEKNTGRKIKFTSALIIDKTNSKRLFAGSEEGLWVSENSGNAWKLNALKDKGIRTIVQHPRSPKLLAIGTEEDGVFLSKDGGKTWKQKNSGLQHLTIYAIAFDPNNENILYTGGFKSGVYKTVDGGESWRQMNNGLIPLAELDIHALAVYPRNSQMVFVGTINGGLFRSIDGGATWTDFSGSALQEGQIWDIVIQ